MTMDKEPQIPPRPNDDEINRRRSAFISSASATSGTSATTAATATWGRLSSLEAELWDYVPPVPATTDNSNDVNISKSPSTTATPFGDHRNNLMYDLNDRFGRESSNDHHQSRSQPPPLLLQRPNHLFKSKRLSASSDQLSPKGGATGLNSNQSKCMIDWRDTVEDDHQQPSQQPSKKSYKEKILELLKTPSSSAVGSSPNTFGHHHHQMRSNSLSSNTLPNMNLQFQRNPLYNAIVEHPPATSNQQVIEYAKLYWPSTTSSTSSATAAQPTFSSSLPGRNVGFGHNGSGHNGNGHNNHCLSPMSPLSPIYSNQFMVNPFRFPPPDQIMNLKLIDKINSTKQQQENQSKMSKSHSFDSGSAILQPNILSPTTAAAAAVGDPKQIIDLFDPLVERIPLIPEDEQLKARATPPVYVNTASQSNDNRSNGDDQQRKSQQLWPQPNESNSNSKNSTVFDAFKVVKRPDHRFNKEYDEYCEHLRSLYMTMFMAKRTTRSSTMNSVNSGIVYSSKIDIDNGHNNCSHAVITNDEFKYHSYYNSNNDNNNVNNGGNGHNADHDPLNDKLYFYGINNELSSIDNQFSSNNNVYNVTTPTNDANGNNDENIIIVDIRFTSLIYRRITGCNGHNGKLPLESFNNNSFKALDTSGHWFSMKFPVDYHQQISIIISHVVNNITDNGNITIQDDDDGDGHNGGGNGHNGNGHNDININDFLLKLYDKNEYLHNDCRLSSYCYVQTLKINNNDLILELVDTRVPEFCRPYLRCQRDTDRIMSDADFNYKQLIPKKYLTNFHGVNYDQLNQLIDELNFAYTMIISSIFDSDSIDTIDDTISVEKLFNDFTRKIHQIQQYLSNIISSDLLISLEKLQSLLKDFEFSLNNRCNNERNNRYNRKDLIANYAEKFEFEFIQIVQILIRYIRMYSRLFPVDFQIDPIADNGGKITKLINFDDLNHSKSSCNNSKNSCNNSKNPCNNTLKRSRPKRQDIKQLIDLFQIHLDVCTQLSGQLSSSNYNNYSVLINLFHGTNLLKSMVTDRTRIQLKNQSKCLIFNQLIDFGVPLSTLPRETRIELVLIGFRAKSEVDALATTFLYLYDLDEILQNGYHLLVWSELVQPYTFPPMSLDYDFPEKLQILREFLENNYRISPEMNPDAMMIIVCLMPSLSTTLSSSNIDYCFPEIRLKPSQDPSQMSLNTVVPMIKRDNPTFNGDSLYGFHGYNTQKLTNNLLKILQKSPIEQLTSKERDIIWKQQKTLREYPGLILKLLKSPPSWSYDNLAAIYNLLNAFDSDFTGGQRIFYTKIEAIQLLGIDYPDRYLRRTVVKWLNSISVDELCDYLPQLIQTLRYEQSIDCHLIWSLFEFSLLSARFCHYFYWQLKSCTSDPIFGPRCQLYLESLRQIAGERSGKQFAEQEQICREFSQLSAEIKQTAKDMRSPLLRQRLERINEHLHRFPRSLPLSPSLFVNGLAVDQCSYFNSNSLPLKLVFESSPPYLIDDSGNGNGTDNSNKQSKLLQSIYRSRHHLHKIIFKCGDDLRKDMLVMQIIAIINRCWLRAGLNLRLIIFSVLNTANCTGMIEMVTRASTLREIQQEYGITGNFKPHTIATWLKRYNTNEFTYKLAIENFIHSCAGYVVITYLLGICDRHNDNIMVTTAGNLFHIDFGKFFGDAQMMAGIRRDRVPFVFTADMAFVINEGGRPSKNYQFFVDLCCRCFMLVRQNGDFLLSLMSMMIRSGIDSVTPEAIQYFHKALMPQLIESQAKVEFNRLIEKALKSFSTQLNFFLHSIAQSFAASSSSGGAASGSSNNPIDDNNNNGTFTVDDNYEMADLDDDSVIVNAINATLNTLNNNNVTKNTGNHQLPQDDQELIMNELCQFTFTKCRVNHSKSTTNATTEHITRVEIVDIFANTSNRVQYYKLKIDYHNYPEQFVYRSYKEFLELQSKLLRLFPLATFHQLSSSTKQQQQRLLDLNQFINTLMAMASEISHCDLIYTFFHPILRDQQFLDYELQNSPSVTDGAKSATTANNSHQVALQQQRSLTTSRSRQPKIKLNLNYRDEQLNVLICHVRNLDSTIVGANGAQQFSNATINRSLAPDTYVKLYLRPDPNKVTKRKTRTIARNPHPTFMETFAYKYKLEYIISKTLEVSVWEYDMTGNKRLGQVEIPLCQIDLFTKNERWYTLQP